MSVVFSQEEILKTIAENNYIPEEAKNHMTTEQFRELYGPEALKKFPKGKELLEFLFGTKEQNELSMAYSVEDKPNVSSYFGAANPGWATTKVLNFSKGSWKHYKENIDESEAIELSDGIRNSLVAAIQKIELENTAGEVLALLKKENLPDNPNWLRKYLTILYPDKFMPMLNDDWTNRIFVRLGLTHGKDWYESSDIYSKKAAEYGVDCINLYHVVFKLAVDQTRAELQELGLDPKILGTSEKLLLTTRDALQRLKNDKKKKLKTEEEKAQFEEAMAPFEVYFAQKFNWNSEKGAKSDTPSEEGQKSVQVDPFVKKYAQIVMTSKNTIFRGAPGTGKSYLANAIAAYIVSDGKKDARDQLSKEEKQQVAFVQFHPSYDYSDFVEGLRPVVAADGSMGFELRPGVFKAFVEKARKNLENSRKSQVEIAKEQSIEDRLEAFLEEYQESGDSLELKNGNKFIVEDYDEKYVYVRVPDNEKTEKVKVSIGEIKSLLASGQSFAAVKDIKNFFGKKNNTQQHSYELSICKVISEMAPVTVKVPAEKEEEKNYVFIIDEINRGEISKILGELFFSIDPGYRGKKGEVKTQYHNMHDEDEGDFYIPKNVYIIGTMNDIDRSVDTFDFAMRRRFRFIEIDANTHVDMLDQLGSKKDEAVRRMKALNAVIEEKLNKNYQIGAAYFLKLKDIDFDQLWTDHLEPLLQEYVNGAFDETDQMESFRKAYQLKNQTGEENNENAG